MKNILLVATQDYDGAGEAILKLAKILSTNNNVALLVKVKTKADKFIYEYNYSRYQIYKKKITDKYRSLVNKNSDFDDNYSFFATDEDKKNVDAGKIVKIIGFVPDIIFNGWSSDFMNSTDFLNLQLYTNAKVFNVTLDMNHFTGGCHYAWDCTKYKDGCDNGCPALLSNKDKSVALRNFNKKIENVRKGDFKIIAASGWTLKQARESKIYKNQEIIHNINSLIDTDIMNDNCRNIAKQIFGLDNDCFYILTGCKDATQLRKGFNYLVEGLNLLSQKIEKNQSKKIKIILVTDKKDSSSFDLIPFEKQYVSFIKDYRLLSLLYQAADLYVNTSIEDSGPMMVSEALACGTPVVGFDMGVVNNMVVNNYNGYKARLKDSFDLANGIQEILNLNAKEYLVYSKNSVLSVENYSSFEYGKSVIDQIID